MQSYRSNFNKALLARAPDHYLPKKALHPRSDIRRIAHCGSTGTRPPSFQEGLQSLDFPLAAPSANLSNSTSPTCPQHILDSFGEKAPKVLEGGSCEIDWSPPWSPWWTRKISKFYARAPSAKRNWKKYLAKLLPNPKLLRIKKSNLYNILQTAKSFPRYGIGSLCSQNSFVFV